jgi:hypothetical protein
MNIASAFITGAQLIRRPPEERLRPFVGCFWALPCTPVTRISSLPDGCCTLSVELSARGRAQSFITGPRLAPRELVPAQNMTLLGVRLRPGVVCALTGIPASELTERREPLARWRSRDALELESGLSAASSDEHRFDVLERFVGRRLLDASIDTRVLGAVRLLEHCAGRMKIADLDPVSAPAFAQLASGLGYFDQAHLSNEFAHLAGWSPSRVAPERVADFSKTQCG